MVKLKWNQDVNTAITQIKEKKYPSVLEKYKDNLILVGITYDKKTHMQNRATLIARFFLFLTHKALTQVLGLNSKRYVLHRTQSKHASACEQSLNKSYHSFAAI